MDKISKTIKKIDSKDALRIADTIEQVVKGKLNNLNIKKLKGHKDVFRVRVGNYRVIYKQKSNNIAILHIAHRNGKTYKSL